MAKNSRTIIISGAGVAGLTAALCLAKAGFRIDILERSAGIEHFGAGLQISPNAFYVLEELGLGTQLKAMASAPESIHIIKASTGRSIVHVPLGQESIERYGAPYLIVHRADLCQMLANACHKHPDIDFHLGHRVVDAVPHANGITAMAYHDEKMHEFWGKAMIAADGVWSKFRTEYIEAKPPVYSGMTAWRAMVPGDKVSPRKLAETQLWLASNGHGITYGLRRNSYLNIVLVVKEVSHEKKWDSSADIAQLRRKLSNWHPDFTDLLQARVKWTKWPLYEAPLSKRWAIDKLALVGDSAHAMLPFAAQGAAMAIEDAWVLAEKLGSIDQMDEAFRAYEKTRIPRVTRAMKLAQSNSKIYHMPAGPAAMRDAAMKLMPAKMLLARQDWLYSWRG